VGTGVVCALKTLKRLFHGDVAQRNDGESNLLAAMTIAGHYQIPEVCLFFCNKLLRGCRCVRFPCLPVVIGLGCFLWLGLA
jgi:hypothetical protein